MGKNIATFLLNSKFNVKKAIKNYNFYDKIKNSGLFDEEFYRKTYHSQLEGEDPLTHYLFKGFKKDYCPSRDFDPIFYLESYRDVNRAGINPLLHYVAFGKNENKKIQKVPDIKIKNEIINTNSILLNNYTFEEEPLVSIIILNLNGLEHLQRLFANFDKTINYSNYEIIVVDNGSSDSSVSYLKSLQDKYPISIIENNENYSFSKANNQAAKIAKGQYIVLLNNDIEPTYGWLNELMGVMLNNDDVGAVGSKLIFPFYYDNRNKSFKIQHSGDIFAERRNPGCSYAINKSNKHLDLFDNSLNETSKCISVTGAVMLVKKSVYEQFNGLDESYNYGLEDVDFCLNLYKNNLDVYYCGTSLLFHHESSTRAKSKNYFENDTNNFRTFWNKWGGYLSKNLLLDKIKGNKFFTEKELKIIIFNNKDDNNNLVSKMSKNYQNLDYEINVINDTNDIYVGDSADILIRFSDDFKLDNIISRDDLIVVDIKDDNCSIINLKDKNIIKSFKINYNTLNQDILNNIEELLNESDGFLWDLKIN
ncbi:MAG: glycosyltransferase family 2 protein [Methanobrevibacter sp.]|nr:glycosyltransferase family 2 protein [Methanobrevibacter sp.]